MPTPTTGRLRVPNPSMMVRASLFCVAASSLTLLWEMLAGRVPAGVLPGFYVGIAPLMIAVLVTAHLWASSGVARGRRWAAVISACGGLLLGGMVWALAVLGGIWPLVFRGAVWAPTAWLSGGAAGMVAASRIGPMWNPVVTRQEAIAIVSSTIVATLIPYVPVAIYITSEAIR